MTFTPWETAHGEAAPAFLQCADTVALSPADDSVDTNSVIIEGVGTITSFGDSPHKVIKRVKFVPLVMADRAPGGGGAMIVLVNSTYLNLLGKKNRSFGDTSYGIYFCDGANRWNEIYFTTQGSSLVSELEERLLMLEAKVFGT
jgi:hypothetical protein